MRASPPPPDHLLEGAGHAGMGVQCESASKRAFRRARSLHPQLAVPGVHATDVARLVQQLPSPALVLDDRGRVLLQNAAATQALGELPAGVEGAHLLFACPDVQRRWMRTLETVRHARTAASLVLDAQAGCSWAIHVIAWRLVARRSDGCDQDLRLVTLERCVAPARRHLGSYASAVGLTPAETEVLALLAQGRNAKQVAQARGSSVHTVRSQVKSILGKSGTRSTRELIVRVVAATS